MHNQRKYRSCICCIGQKKRSCPKWCAQSRNTSLHHQSFDPLHLGPGFWNWSKSSYSRASLLSINFWSLANTTWRSSWQKNCAQTSISYVESLNFKRIYDQDKEKKRAQWRSLHCEIFRWFECKGAFEKWCNLQRLYLMWIKS